MPAVREGCAIFSVSPPYRVRPDERGEKLPVLGSHKADVLRAGIDQFFRCRLLVVGEVGTVTVSAERLKEALLDGGKRKGRSRAS